MQRQIIKDRDWNNSFCRTASWEQSVNIVRWEHNYVSKTHIIDYNELGNKCEHVGAFITEAGSFFCPKCLEVWK